MITDFRYQSKFTDTFKYVNDYFDLVNRYYASWNFGRFVCTYYNLDIENSHIDENKLSGGTYEMVGELSGWRWRKILDLDINGLETLPTNPTTDERGVTMTDKMTTTTFPKTYGIIPQVHDFVCFSEVHTDDNYILRDPPLYEVVNIERSNDMDVCVFKISLKVSYVRKSQIEKQLSELTHFMDYEKRLYPIDDAIAMQTIMWQNSEAKHKRNVTFDQNSGLYIDTIEC